ncbi:gliding motility-associated C-terminal domain-containing protein [Mesoflavibacter sp. CH_XMU1422-2]|uniref:T9SS type B sorting domain-containing protein n=1 Tax=Mesoflavibacter sp. CH_XMU1422-2 TaxID=3107770 RepID=UPI003009FF94|tara:strand:+ start:108 stop:632 length:525 start_codon:yes stop_codon:yes gene_type:complete
MKNRITILFTIILSFFLTFSCNDNDDEPEQEPELETFLCCGENPFSNSNVDNLDQTMGEIIPSGAFSPNGDGLNDTFAIQNIDLYANNTVIIYDIDDNVVFETNNYETNPFVGLNQSNSSELPFGTYKYKIVIENETTFVEFGYVCLIRNFSESGDFSFINCTAEDPNDPLLAQ